MSVTFADVERARETIAADLRPTPVYTATRLGERAGVDLRVKVEALQRTGSFKARGALNRVRNTPAAELERGLITVSAGNHAGALAWAARTVAAPCTVVMPAATGRLKVEAARGYGAEVVLYGTVTEAFAEMDQLREERDLVLVHPFDDPLVIAGQGTVGLELVDQVPEADVVVVPVGGGGLIAGVARAVKTLRPDARVYGVEPEGASAMRASLARGEPVRLDRVDTIVDSLAAPYTGAAPFAVVRDLLAGVATVTDREILEAVRAVLHFTKLYVEPAGAAAVAALLAGRVPVTSGETVAAVLSGGNLDPDELPRLFERGPGGAA